MEPAGIVRMARIEWFDKPDTPWAPVLYSLNSKYDEPIVHYYAGTYGIIGIVRRDSAEDNEQFDLHKLYEEWKASEK